MITQQELKDKLEYDKDTGIFIWKVSNGGRSSAGKIAGGLSHGYREIKVNKKKYMSHRLAWLYVYGEFPKNHIDHINRVKDDNRICNLRDVTMAENNRNIGIRKDNTSGHIGVVRDRTKWRAYITVNKKTINLGNHSQKEDAIKARKEAEIKYNCNNTRY
jgi:hypothetical protein